MKKLKKLMFFAAIMTLFTCLLCMALSAETVSGTCGAEGDGSNLTWTLDTETGVLKIEGEGAMRDYSYMGAPWYCYLEYIENVKVGEGITNIGNSTFVHCSSITNVTIPETVTRIGDYAFNQCHGLKEIELPNNTTYIGADAFGMCIALKKINIPSSVITIGTYAFSSCESLVSITIPYSVTIIGDNAFSYCSSLESITVEEGNTAYHSAGNCLVATANKELIAGCNDSIIPADGSVVSIGERAFSNRHQLTNIIIPNGITNIKKEAFWSCSRLLKIVLPESITEIDSDAFYACSELYFVYNNCNLTLIPGNIDSGRIAQNARVVIRKDGIVSYKEDSDFTYVFTDDEFLFEIKDTQYKLIAYAGDLDTVVFPNSINGKSYSIYQMKGVKNVILPNGITAIGSEAFFDSTLTSIVIPDSVTTIESLAFDGCRSLTSITIPNSVKTICYMAFGYCGFTNIEIPGSVTRIDEGAFSGCNLVNIKVSKNNTIYHNDGNCIIETASKTLILGCNNSIIPTDGSVTSIGDDAFSDCFNLASITIPDSITSIGIGAFYRCIKLTSIKIPNSVTSIGDHAFSDCHNLTSIDVAKDNQYFCSYNGILYDKPVTKMLYIPSRISGNITIPHGVTNIDDFAFQSRRITNVEMPSSIVSIGNGAFSYCHKLKSIVIPKSVISIGNLAFVSCSELESIIIENGNKSYHSEGNCIIETASKTLILGRNNSIIPTDGSVTSIGDYAFSDCFNLASITIPDSVTNIGEHAFYGCSKLTSIQIPSSVTNIGDYAFLDCFNLTSITILSADVSIADSDGTISESATIYGYKSSTAEIYAQKYNHKFVAIRKIIASGKCGEDLAWSLDDAGRLTIDGIGAMENYELSATPWHNFSADIKNVEIGENVTYIGSFAFYLCQNLKNIVVLSKNTAIHDVSAVFPTESVICGYSKSLAESYAEKHNLKFRNIIAYGSCYNLIWIFDDAGLLTIDGKGVMDDFSSAGATPWAEYRTMITSAEISEGITSLGKYSLWNFSNLTKLVIPSTVTTIKTYTIRVPLTSLVIPEGVKSIEQNAICWCPNLTEVVIPESMEKMAGIAFRSCTKLQKIFILSKNVEISGLLNWSSYTVYGYVGSTAEEHATKQNRKFVPFNGYCGAEGDGSNIAWYFDFKTGELSLNGTGEMKDYYSTRDVPWYMLTERVNSVDISDGITKIGSEAFANCRKLKAIHIPKDIKSFGKWSVFLWCDALETMTVAEENTVYHSEGNCIIETASKTLKFGCKTSIIPDDGSVTSIGESAFNQRKIENITIPEYIVSIDANAFYGCDNLTSITIPKNVTSIGGSVFGGCSNLENIYVDAENTSYYVKNNCLIEKETKTLIAGCNDSIIPDDGSVTVIGSGALSGRKMARVTIPNSITTIGSSAFFGCPNLESVSIPDSVTIIKSQAFGNNLKLTHITIPASVTTIEFQVFWYCDNLASITILSKDVEIHDYSTTIPENTIIYGYSGSTAEAYAAKYDRKFAVFSGTCGAEGDGSNLVWFFDAETGLLKIDGTGKMKSPIMISTAQNDIWHNKYIEQKIKTVEISEGVTSIGRGAFMVCYNLVNVSMPDSLATIEMYAFDGCTSLEKIYIPAGVTYIEHSILSLCYNLESITVAKENITYHSEGNCLIETASGTLVAGCKSSVIPTDGSVKAIAQDAFDGCQYLLNITIPSSVISIGYTAFNGCVGLTEIIIPDSVIEINWGAFGNCSGLTEITIPASVTKIDGAIIWGKNVKLTGIYVDKASNSFKSVDGILFTKDGKRLVNYLPGKEDKSYTVPRGVETIDMLAFFASNIESIDIPDSVTSIEGWAFSNCSNLTSIVIPSSVTSITYSVFSDCTSLTAVTILSKDVEIHDDSYAIPEAATIYGYSGSTAEAYATKYNRKFVAIDKYDSMNAGATLNENITMNFIGTALTKEDVDGNDFKMTFVMNGSKTSVSPVEKNGKYTFPFAGIAPQCMNDEISYEMTMNGAVVKQGSISVSGYLKQLIEKKPDDMTDAKFKAMSTLVSDMLNYGSAAQAYTGHGTDSLLNENYYDDIVNKYTELESTDKALSGAAPVGAKFTNVGVRFDNVNKVFFRFTADDISKVIITINGVAYGQDKFVKTGDKYTVYSEDILASKFDTVYTAILTYIGTDEKQMMTYSVKSFAYSFQNKRGEDGKLTAEAVLARATYTYGVSAKAYENAE